MMKNTGHVWRQVVIQCCMAENWCFLLSSAAATSSEVGVQGAEADILYCSVNDDSWYGRPGVALYRT